MKQLALHFLLVLVMADTALAQQASSPQAMNRPFASGPSPQGISSPGFGPAMISPQEMQELRAAHSAALQANPDLLAANQQLLERMRAFDAKINAAMIKADPSLAPIIAKYEAGRRPPGMVTSTPPPTSSSTAK